MKNTVDAFRKDINGLRAWAVVAVVLFHFGVPGFDGGFVGVDIFFVISGFLMTGIIMRGLGADEAGVVVPNRFSFLRFYLARARRIIPALLFLFFILIVAGWFFLSPADYKVLANHMLRAAAFISNIQFERESGYFDADAHDKLLLHTWSLSVEWQFYLILPFLIFVLWKLYSRVWFVVAGLVAFAFISFGLSVYLAKVKPESAFYLLQSRAWEMLVGSLVYFARDFLHKNKQLRLFAEVIGFSLIIISVATFSSDMLWPGYNAVIPVVGSALVILSGLQGSLLTGGLVFQWFGNISYSLYLWHWPVVFMLNYVGVEEDFYWIILGVFVSVALGWLSCLYVESFSKSKLASYSNSKQFLIVFFAIFFVALTAHFVKEHDGFNGRFSKEVNVIFAEAYNQNPRRDECHVRNDEVVPGCVYGGDELGIIVIGDSHAQSIIRSVEKSLPDSDFHVLDWTLSSCPTIRFIKDVKAGEKFQCGYFVDDALRRSQEIPSNVPLLIVNRSSLYIEGDNRIGRKKDDSVPSRYIHEPHTSRSSDYDQDIFDGMVSTACEFARHRTVYMLRPIPELKHIVPVIMGNAAVKGINKRVSVSLDEYYERNKIAWAAQDTAAQKCGVKILDPLSYLCDGQQCWGDVDGMPIYYDDNHLSERGGQLLIPLFRQMFEQSLYADE